MEKKIPIIWVFCWERGTCLFIPWAAYFNKFPVFAMRWSWKYLTEGLPRDTHVRTFYNCLRLSLSTSSFAFSGGKEWSFMPVYLELLMIRKCTVLWTECVVIKTLNKLNSSIRTIKSNCLFLPEMNKSHQSLLERCWVGHLLLQAFSLPPRGFGLVSPTFCLWHWLLVKMSLLFPLPLLGISGVEKSLCKIIINSVAFLLSPSSAVYHCPLERE